MAKKDVNNMSFLDHLEELRWHLIRCTLAVLIGAIVAFIAKEFIFDVLILGPTNPNFVTYEILCKLSGYLGLDDSFCLEKLDFEIQSRTMAGQFSAHLWTSITAGIIMAFPYILFEFLSQPHISWHYV